MRCLQSIGAEGQLPQHLVLQSDNTTSFSKNHGVHMMASWLVASRCFASVTLNYLVVGHTHEDVDAFLAELLPVLRRSMFNSTSDAVSVLKQALQGKADALNEQLLVEECNSVHAWTDYFSNLGVSLSNAPLPTKKSGPVPYSFSYKRRMDLSAHELGQLAARERSGKQNDVFVICKARMCDTNALKPVLTLPAERLERLPYSLRDLPLKPRVALSDVRAQNLRKLARILGSNPYNRADAAQALSDLAGGVFNDEEKTFPWALEDRPVELPALIVSANPYFPHLPEPCSFKLFSQFPFVWNLF